MINWKSSRPNQQVTKEATTLFISLEGEMLRVKPMELHKELAVQFGEIQTTEVTIIISWPRMLVSGFLSQEVTIPMIKDGLCKQNLEILKKF